MKKLSIHSPLFCTVCLSALLVGFGTSAQAASYYLQEQSVSGLGSAFAGQQARARDASIIFYNPAGMTQLEGGQVNLGMHGLLLEAEMTDTGSTAPATFGGGPIGGSDGGNPFNPALIPNAYISQQITDYMWLGLGVNAPFGLKNQYNDTFFGRYDGLDNKLETIEVSPSVAFKVNDWLSLGGSVRIQRADARLTSAISAAPGTEGRQTLRGEGYDVGYDIGVLVTPLPTTSIGLNYKSAINNNLEGEFIIEGSGSPLVDTFLQANATLNLPDITTLGVSHQLNDQWTVLGSAMHYGWKNFENIIINSNAGPNIGSISQDYDDTWGFAVGAEYALNPAWTLRAGYQYDQTPTGDERSTRIPDGDRNWFTAGATYSMNEKWSFDVGAAYIHVSKEDINLTRNVPGNTVTVSGESEGQVGIISAAMNYKF